MSGGVLGGSCLNYFNVIEKICDDYLGSTSVVVAGELWIYSNPFQTSLGRIRYRLEASFL